MATKLATIIADFTTQLASELAVGGTTATLSSATDDDGVALPSGRYFFTIDGANSNKEHISCDLSGTSLTNIKTVSRQGVETAGVLRKHRIGASIGITDFAHILQINALLAGTTDLNYLVPLKYDGTATISDLKHIATKEYADALAIAGAPNGTTSTKGIFQEATQAQILSKTGTGSTGADLVVNPSNLASTLLSDYKADTGSANAYAIAPAPAITAYTVGQVFSFKATNANTTASTLNVNALGTKTIKKLGGATDLASGDIAAGMVVLVEYDGTNFIMLNPVANAPLSPTGDGSGLSGVGTKLNINTTVVDVGTSSTAENTLFTYALAGGVLSTNNAVKVSGYITLSNAGSIETITLRFKYGATTLYSPTFALSGALTNYTYKFELTLIASGSTSSQTTDLVYVGTSNVVSASAQTATSSEDSTSSKNIIITAQDSVSDSNFHAVIRNVIVTKIV